MKTMPLQQIAYQDRSKGPYIVTAWTALATFTGRFELATEAMATAVATSEVPHVLAVLVAFQWHHGGQTHLQTLVWHGPRLPCGCGATHPICSLPHAVFLGEDACRDLKPAKETT